jgi:pyruvate,water dikinase
MKEKLWDYVPGFDFNEEVDLKVWPSWFLDFGHSVPPWTPLYGWFWSRGVSHGQQAAAETLSQPAYKGTQLRYRDGGSYMAIICIRDEEEIKQRTPKHREALRPYLEDFDGIWKKYKEELLGLYEPLKAINLDEATNLELLHHHFDLTAMYWRMWEIHFLALVPAFSGWILFEDVCKERFGIRDQSPEFQKMMSGFENKVYQVDRELWELGRLASEMGLMDIFLNNDPKSVVPMLEKSEPGREWLKKFRDFLNVEGWRMLRMNEFTEPYWLEEPSAPIAIIKDYLAKGGKFVFDETREKLAKEREEAIEAFMGRVPAEDKEWILALMRLAQKAGSINEEHDLYCELYSQAVMRRGYLGIGRRLVKSGTIDRPDDIFLLNPEEIETALMIPEIHDLRYITNRRRKEWEEWQTRPNPPLFTTRSDMAEAVAKDLMPSRCPIMIKLGVGEMPEVRPELKADLYGLAASTGEAEGPARVVLSYDELSKVQDGDILVAVSTNPAWTPVFGRIKGIVIDGGGTLCHPAVVARDFGIPAVVNCFEGTTKIKDNQRIRVNGTEGTVYILDK